MQIALSLPSRMGFGVAIIDVDDDDDQCCHWSSYTEKHPKDNDSGATTAKGKFQNFMHPFGINISAAARNYVRRE